MTVRVLTLILIFQFVFNRSGASNIDSLQHVYQNEALEDTSRILALAKISFSHLYSNPDSAFQCAAIQYNWAKNVNYLYGMLTALNTQGSSFVVRGQLDTALTFFEKVVVLQKGSSLKGSLASAYGNIGAVYVQKRNYPKAMSYNLKSLKLKEETGDKYEIAGSYINIGIIFSMQEDYKKSLEYNLKAKKIQEELNNETLLNYLVGNIAVLYTNLKKYDTAIVYSNQALKLSKKLKNNRGILVSMINLSSSYKKLKKYDISEKISFEILAMLDTINIGDFEATVLNNLGGLYYEKANYTKAKEYSLRAFNLAEKNKSPQTLKLASINLYKTYKELGDYKASLKMHETYLLMKDSLDAIDLRKKTLEQEFEYLFEKQAIEDKVNLESQKEIASVKRKNERYTLISLFCLIIIGIGLFLKNRSSRIKLERQQLLQEIKLLKAEAVLKTTPSLAFTNENLNKEKIDLTIEKVLNPSDWNILNSICENPTFTNAAIAEKVSLSVQGVSSSLKKMYQLFNLKKEKENQKMALAAKVIKISIS